MLELIREFITYAKENKKMWLIPVIIFLIMFGALLFFAKGSVVAPFIYTLF
jgi:hypothetical protein